MPNGTTPASSPAAAGASLRAARRALRRATPAHDDTGSPRQFASHTVAVLAAGAHGWRLIGAEA